MSASAPLFALALLVSAPAFASEIVSVHNFRSVELRGGGLVDVLPGPVQQVAIVEGTSQLTHMYVDREGMLVIRTCDEHCPPAYRLRVQIRSPQVPDLAIDGGGTIVAGPGFASQAHLSAAVNGGGRIDARPIDAARVLAAVNGGGELLVRARTSLSAAVNGGGHIRYWGTPATSIAVHGGGGVTRGN